MKYYKLLNEAFIGVINSNDFVRENPNNGWLLTSNESLGQFAIFENQLYRDYWMQPIPNSTYNYIQVNIKETTEEEYNALKKAIDNNEQIIIDDDDDDDEPIVVPVEKDDPDYTLEFIRSSKLLEMSQACRRTIEEGFDLELRGETHHFSLTIQDQLNLMSLGATMQADSLIPYHADGEETAFYSANEINQIIAAAQAHKDYQTTYYNSLKAYINSLDTIEAIAAITYGTPIPDEYKSDVLMVLE